MRKWILQKRALNKKNSQALDCVSVFCSDLEFFQTETKFISAQRKKISFKNWVEKLVIFRIKYFCSLGEGWVDKRTIAASLVPRVFF